MEVLSLYNLNGALLNLETVDLFGLDLKVPAPSWSFESVVVEGMDGEQVIDKKLNPRPLTAEFLTKSGDWIEATRVRDEIYSLLMTGQPFYIGEESASGKRWKVWPESWTPERLNPKVYRFEVPLLAKSGVSESVHLAQRKFNASKFRFENEGTFKIDMRVQNETEIEFRGASTNLAIINRTTGEMWSYDGSTTAEDILLLKGVRSTKNGTSIFGSTNKKLLTFAPGWNEIEVTGAADFTIEIRTRFYFL